jgi:hypothetical protein
MVHMDTSGKSREQYDTDTLILCIIVYTFVYNVIFCIVEGQYGGLIPISSTFGCLCIGMTRGDAKAYK